MQVSTTEMQSGFILDLFRIYPGFIPGGREHGPQLKPREPCAHFPYYVRSKLTPSNDIVHSKEFR